MIYSNDNKFQFWQFKAEFLNNGEPAEMFTNNKTEIEDMFKAYPQMSGLVFSNVTFSQEQKDRLDIVNDIEAEHKDMWSSEVQLFVLHGAILDDSNSEFLMSIKDDYLELTTAYLNAGKQKKILEFDKQLTDYYDSKAQEKNYDNRVTCALRAGYPSAFQAEGRAFAEWMDSCNVRGYQLIDEILSGVRPEPDSFDEILAELPVLTWPA